MDGILAIEHNRQALKRILATLFAMAGFGSGGQFTFFPQEGALAQNRAQAEKSKLSPALTLPAISIWPFFGCCARPNPRRGG